MMLKMFVVLGVVSGMISIAIIALWAWAVFY
jgi:hypothetical protein